MIPRSVLLINYFCFVLAADNILAEQCTVSQNNICVEGRGTRVINGVPVTLDCWRYRTVYECRDSSDNNCEQLRKEKCSQLNAVCRTQPHNICTVQDQIYSCPVEQCEEFGKINCAKDVFCLGKDCINTNKTTNTKRNEAFAQLAALNAAATEVKNQNVEHPTVFAGTPMECSRSIANAKNCCHGSGWAEGILFGCDGEEESLGKARESSRALPIGDGNNEYCHNEVLGICTSHHQVYCVFPSKLARIIQQYGRRNQLGISFGHVSDDSAHPNCRGITPEELAKLDFNKIDFSELYGEIEAKAKEHLPIPNDLKNKAENTPFDTLKAQSVKNLSGLNDNTQKISDRIKEFYARANKPIFSS